MKTLLFLIIATILVIGFTSHKDSLTYLLTWVGVIAFVLYFFYQCNQAVKEEEARQERYEKALEERRELRMKYERMLRESDNQNTE